MQNMLLHILCIVMMMVSAIMCTPGQDGTIEMRLAKKDKYNYPDKSNSHSGTLDPIGGGHLLRSLDSNTGRQRRENEIARAREPNSNDHLEMRNSILSVVDPLGGDNFIGFRPTKKENSNKHRGKSSSGHGNLDSIGGGNLIGRDSFERDNQVGALDSQNKEDKNQDTINSMLQSFLDALGLGNFINLDPIGGGNLVVVDPLGGGNLVVVDPLGGGNLVNLDPIGGGNLINLDPLGGGNLVVLDPLGGGNLLVVDPLGGGNLVKSRDFDAREVKSRNHRNSNRHILDPLGGGHLLRSLESDTGEKVRKSLHDGKGRQNMMRLAREDKSNNHAGNPMHAIVDPLGGGNFVRSRDSILRSLDRNHALDSLDGGEVVRMLDAITGGDLLSTLESAEGAAVLRALKSSATNKHPKRMLDSVSGWSFGESKRNFDEIDNVGFTGFAKRMGPYYHRLALAKKNFDEIDRAGFETYNKRNFDEIDRTGFETFEKKEARK